jgi:hypothetical protein
VVDATATDHRRARRPVGRDAGGARVTAIANLMAAIVLSLGISRDKDRRIML